jgi:hypothetical protein
VRLLLGSAVVVAAVLVCSPSSPAHLEAGRASCDEAGTRALVFGFARAFNRGDSKSLDRLWAREPGFRWFTAEQADPELGHGVFHRPGLLRYFARRHRQQERIRLIRFRFNGQGGGHGHFEYRLERTALDLSRSKPVYDGKGATACFLPRPALAVWSMGTA